MTTKAVRQQEEQAISQIYLLHSSLINVMDENKTLQNEMATIEHQMAVDETLHLQVCTITLIPYSCVVLETQIFVNFEDISSTSCMVYSTNYKTK